MTPIISTKHRKLPARMKAIVTQVEEGTFQRPPKTIFSSKGPILVSNGNRMRLLTAILSHKFV